MALQLTDHVFDALEIGFRGLELEFGLVAARVQAGDPRRLFENPASRLRLGIDELADLALAHQGRRTGSRRGVGEQELDVTGPYVAAVDAIGRPGIALDAAYDFDGLVIVELGRGGALGVVERDRHLGHVPRRAVRRSGKDDVIHARGAHALEGVFPHDPAQGLEQVRLAAAVRADDAGEPAFDDHLGRLDEGFEPREPEPRELHGWRMLPDPLAAAASLS